MLLFLNNSMCSQAFSQINTTLHVDKLSVYPWLHLEEICISVTKCSWQIWKCHICLQNKHRSYKPPQLLTYYFLCTLEVLWTAYPSYFVFNVISKLISTMERRKTFSFPCLLNSQKGKVLSVTMLHQLYISPGEESKVAFPLGEKISLF